VRNCRFSGTDTGLRFKSGLGRGGKTEQMFISDIVMTDIKDEAIVFQCDYFDKPAGSTKTDPEFTDFTEEQQQAIPIFQDIHINNVVCRGAKTGIKASGSLGLGAEYDKAPYVNNIDIQNTTIVYQKDGQVIDNKTAQLKLTNVRLLPEKQQ
jgi:polygalacturonase